MSTVNYYPALRGRKMWYGQYFDIAQITRDFKLLHQTFNWDTIRIFAIISAFNATDATGSFNIGGAGPTSAQKARLTQVCNAALSVGCRLHLTLFDGWAQYGAFDQGTAWINALGSATPIGVPPTSIFEVIEFQNEMPADNTSTYTAGGANAVAGWTIQQAVVAAAQNLIPTMRAAWPGVPITVSTTHDPKVTMTYVMNNLTGTSKPDWVEPHLYPPHDTLSNMQYMVTNWTRSARIGEFGWPTFSGGGETGQDNYYNTFLANWATANPTGYPASPWMAFDADPFQGLSNDEATYGLIALDGHYHTAVLRYLRTPPPVTRFISINGVRFRRGLVTTTTTVDQTATPTAIAAGTTFGTPTVVTGGSGTITVTDNANGTATISGTGVSAVAGTDTYVISGAGVTDNGNDTFTLTTG
jgi:hypothetical protein